MRVEVELNEGADLFVIVPWVPAGCSWKAQSTNGVSCCGEGHDFVSITTGKRKLGIIFSISFLEG
jgi:hypothetical protein